ncbi:MAG: hypothetical protein A3H72_03710 [Candidatus Doudnabacteria bacterium RIFCSPLOWO2_02_FULL_48_8]|uniref:DUF86 domain-containing protein n=1 Tax=Candidatus Doudnabacteria bacterium RIFCSPHIGHO2_01_FULL_46_24 TaxID=1817825 RepID=A0A1F5NTN2_9BACT|nr:MAG: hypothetical protein A2720_03960 [Candidatus Doudnabacteria bacterium RIFCSPHIGHO2_01_FULL_46_24]OGE95489.1 MAG: hypothetical protein A3H72_03710 [Candidatus Doudnabacteria bacterium RIFCSPLOWO2_02_FULL_48_8]OGE95895.1 MAG: hypothetical protein A3E98_03970 [Candidatus Doudnabacteria bacterium RIFCSPHIGHO2_12_FULL_48_11]
MKNDKIYINHILDAIGKIKAYVGNGNFDDFGTDPKLQDAVIRNLEIIGEASKRLSEDFKSKVNLPWNDIGGMRNKIVHDYFEIHLGIVWKTATSDIVEVEQALLPYRES